MQNSAAISHLIQQEESTEQNDEMLSSPATLYTIAVTGGKGGVGKTNIAANLALAMTQFGKRVGIFDADLGLANIDVLFRLNPRYTLKHVLAGEKSIEDIIVEGPLGISVIPASSGISALANLPASSRKKLIGELGRLANILDILIIDTPAGIGDNVLSFVLASDEILVVTTPDPQAYLNAYALIKVISNKRKGRFNLLVNMVKSMAQARETADILQAVAKRYLNLSGISLVGYIPNDARFRNAFLREGAPLILEYPESRSAKCLKALAKKFVTAMERREQSTDFFSNVEEFQSNQSRDDKEIED